MNSNDKEMKHFFDSANDNTNHKLVYIASPYFHNDLNIKLARLEANRIAVNVLINNYEEIIPFSPILYQSALDEFDNDNLVIESCCGWYNFDLIFLKKCDVMKVLKLPGWEQSKGVFMEIGVAKALGIPIEYWEWDDFCRHLNSGFKATLEI